jgi:hypothetical protein
MYLGVLPTGYIVPHYDPRTISNITLQHVTASQPLPRGNSMDVPALKTEATMGAGARRSLHPHDRGCGLGTGVDGH